MQQMYRMNMQRATHSWIFFKLAVILSLIALPIALFSQDNVRCNGMLPRDGEFLVATSMGLGGIANFDHYMSLNKYTGSQMVVSNYRMMSRPEARVFENIERECVVSFAGMTDKAGLGLSLMAYVGYMNKWNYILLEHEHLTIYGGPSLISRIGGLYNVRNSNNPSQAYLHCSFAPQINATYRFQIFNYPMAVSAYLALPLFGVSFAPDYGELYYEMYISNRILDDIRFISPLNYSSVYSRLSLDMPLKRCQMRISCDYNALYTDIGSNARAMMNGIVYVGLVRKFKSLDYAK